MAMIPRDAEGLLELAHDSLTDYDNQQAQIEGPMSGSDEIRLGLLLQESIAFSLLALVCSLRRLPTDLRQP